MRRLPFLAAFLVVAATLAAAALILFDRTGDEAALTDPAGSVLAEPAGDAGTAGCSACTARHRRLQRNRQGEE